ncbi:heavy metal translocating P-type ATPase [Thalassotalea ganghwensis]
MSSSCFHCGEPIPQGITLTTLIKNKAEHMCCVGCQAIAETIVNSGLEEYYQFRTEKAPKGEQLIPAELAKKKLLDDDSLQSEFTFNHGTQKEAILTIEGINCAACAWLIEMQTAKIPGIIAISVNATTQRATVKWDSQQVKLSEILIAINDIGYQATPFKANDIEKNNNARAKVFIKRLGISGILMMQVMMIAIGMYFGAFSDMSDSIKVYLRWTSLMLTFPIVTYGAYPFYKGAINALKIKRLSMDVPVSIAISLAFTASAWATINQTGEVYFESVSMFTFLLLVGKFLEFRARSRAAEVSANLLKLMPLTATKLTENQEIIVAAKHLTPNDIVLVKPGETVPADGIIVHGQSQLNESMLSGEQTPLTKTMNDEVFAGTINTDGNITIKVKHDNQHSFLSQLIRLSESSQAHKPKLAMLSDKIAQYFVALILVCAVATAIYWQQHMPEEAFWITLSVLVATCPCALSLATPTALTCATTRLNKEGIMIKSGHVLETMPSVDCIAFDKTGTLTSGQVQISAINILEPSYSKEDLLALSAALESYSEHPIASAFKQFRNFQVNAEDVQIISGSGIKGVIDGHQYAIGRSSWLSESKEDTEQARCVLAKNGKLLASFSFIDQIRDDAKALVDSLKKKHVKTIMLSGDNLAGCQTVQDALTLDHIYASCSAEDKMKKLKHYQQKFTVAMLGDGVNDSPVFGAAHISVAMGGGTDVAKSGADVILLNNRLSSMKTLFNISVKTKRVIKQNYAWAMGYNAIVLPLAVSGHITPYMAVVGMSLSSILVITNSLRLLKRGSK